MGKILTTILYLKFVAYVPDPSLIKGLPPPLSLPSTPTGTCTCIHSVMYHIFIYQHANMFTYIKQINAIFVTLSQKANQLTLVLY